MADKKIKDMTRAEMMVVISGLQNDSEKLTKLMNCMADEAKLDKRKIKSATEEISSINDEKINLYAVMNRLDYVIKAYQEVHFDSSLIVCSCKKPEQSREELFLNHLQSLIDSFTLPQSTMSSCTAHALGRNIF